MNVLYFKVLLFVVLIGFIGCLTILLPHIHDYLRNRAFVRRITILEESLDSKLRCAFGILESSVKICGKYRGRPIRFPSYSFQSGRHSGFTLMSTKLPRQKRLLSRYPTVSENVHHMGRRLVYSIHDGFVSEPTILEKAQAIRILDELVDAAEKCESQQD